MWLKPVALKRQWRQRMSCQKQNNKYGGEQKQRDLELNVQNCAKIK
jgi:hypothetical protein